MWLVLVTWPVSPDRLMKIVHHASPLRLTLGGSEIERNGKARGNLWVAPRFFFWVRSF